MNSLTLKQLRYFEALARLGHFGQAAEACAISQPALSMQIKDLETGVGVALFERGPRQVRLTDFGEEFARRAREILRSVDDLEDLSRGAGGRFGGRLRLGVIPTIAPYLLPRLVVLLGKAHPELDLHVREAVTPKLLRDLIDGALDTALVALPVSEPALLELPIFSETFVLVRPAHEAHNPVPSPEKLREMRLLLLEEGHCFRNQALAFCKMDRRPPRELLDGSALSTLVQMVGAGIGVTLIPEMAVPVETRSAPVSVARFNDSQPSRSVGLIWRRSSPLSARMGALAALVLEAATQLYGHPPATPVKTRS